MVKAILSDKQLEILYEHFDESVIEQVSELLLDLYSDSAEIIEYIAKNGVKKGDEINPIAWIKFAQEMVMKVEKLFIDGKEKKILILLLATIIIIKHLPVGPIIQEVLILAMKELLPEIIECMIIASKHINKFGKKLKKRLMKCLCK